MASENISFYYTTDSFDTINKTLTSVGVVSSNYFLRNTSLIEPEIDIESNLSIANANMFYMCSRYYKITECSMINGGIYRIRGKLDAYTYKDNILLSKALVDRTEDSQAINKNIINPDKVNETRTFTTVYNFSGASGAFLDTPCLILTTVCASNPEEPEGE